MRLRSYGTLATALIVVAAASCSNGASTPTTHAAIGGAATRAADKLISSSEAEGTPITHSCIFLATGRLTDDQLAHVASEGWDYVLHETFAGDFTRCLDTTTAEDPSPTTISPAESGVPTIAITEATTDTTESTAPVDTSDGSPNGIAVKFEFLFVDALGYSLNLSGELRVDSTSSDVTNSPPGSTSISVNGGGRLSVENTTPKRTFSFGPFDQMTADLYYSSELIGCPGDEMTWAGDEYCPLFHIPVADGLNASPPLVTDATASFNGVLDSTWTDTEEIARLVADIIDRSQPPSLVILKGQLGDSVTCANGPDDLYNRTGIVNSLSSDGSAELDSTKTVKPAGDGSDPECQQLLPAPAVSTPSTSIGNQDATSTSTSTSQLSETAITAGVQSCPDYQDTQTLPIRVCASGLSVQTLQTGLADRGYSLDTDGFFGPGTEIIIQQFQRSAGLPVTGVVDFDTWRLLFAGSLLHGSDLNGDGAITPEEINYD